MIHELVIGVLQAPYGLRGELKIRSLSGETDHIIALVGKAVRLRMAISGKAGTPEQSRVVESVREVIPHLLLKLKGIESPEEARMFTGCEIIVDRDHASPLGKDEYYIGDLAGCSLVYKGKTIGTVTSIWDSGAHQLLEVKIEDPAEEKGYRNVNVPFMGRFIGTVDLDARIIELLVDWIIE